MPAATPNPKGSALGASGADVLSLENDSLRIVLSTRDGTIQQIENKRSGLQLIRFPTVGPPWRIELEGQEPWIEQFTSFTWDFNDDDDAGHVLTLRWETALGFAVEGRVELSQHDPHARFFVGVSGGADHRIDKVEYPILQGIGDLSDGADSYLAHPQGTGFLFRNPYRLFETDPVRRQGLRYSPYPEGFNGSSMQFMAYYAQGQGGFYLAAHDSSRAMKWLNFFKVAAGALESAFVHQNPDIRPGQGLSVPYPILIGPLVEGNWYEAAERYKAWASQQSWTARGPLSTRRQICRWLLEEVGFATFGVNASHDRAAWLDRFHAITDQPVFHVLGVNWPRAGAGYGNRHPGGREDWFPATFSQANLETIRRNGDYWAPFEFDLLFNENGADGQAISDAKQQLPAEKYSTDQYRFPFVCPATDFLPELHRWRDEQLAGAYDADALYYDISANNVLMTCRAPHHGHPIGGGGWMVDAYTQMYAATKSAAIAAKGSYVPQGAEMISEAFIPYFDFYQARAEASPLSAFEADRFREWIRQGQVEKIPLFTYVYHEYGPVRLDGWSKLSPEVGDLFYWVASRVALWGGLFELNYEFSPLETLDGLAEDPAEHYYQFEPRAYNVDPDKVAFVREVAIARTGFANAYLVYGTMIRPLDIQVSEIELQYHLFNVGRDRPHYDEASTLRVPSVIHAAWRSPDDKLGFFFVNLQQDRPQPVTVEIDPTRYGLAAGTDYQVTQTTATGTESLASSTGPVTFPLTLQPRRVTLLEVAPVAVP